MRVIKERSLGRHLCKLCAGAMAFLALSAAAQSADAKMPLSSVRRVAVVSMLRNTVDMQTEGMKWDYADYKLHTDWNLDELVRDYVTKALGSRLDIRSDALSAQTLSRIQTT